MSTEPDSTDREICAALSVWTERKDLVLVLSGNGPGVDVADAVAAEAPCRATVLSDVCALETEAFLQLVAREAPTVVVGIGGGSVIERMKVAAHLIEARSIAVPTSLSQDGLFAPSAVVKAPDGTTRRYTCAVPDTVIPARSLIDVAPSWTRAACVADLVSNLSAVADCELSMSNGRSGPPLEALDLATKSARLAAASDPDGGAMGLFEAVEMSGRAMAVSGDSRPCSGAEHKIAHAIDLVTGRTTTHGLSVGVATLFVAHLRDDAHLTEVLHAFERHRIPARLDDIGITSDDFVEAVLLAATQRRDRFTVLDTNKQTDRSIRAILESAVIVS